MTVPCGGCIGCRIERARQWSVRIMHETQMHTKNSFITLSYAPEKLPPLGSLDITHFQKFMRRMRKRLPETKIRFFHCGEYGEKLQRPHYHAILFGVDFSGDRYHWTMRNGYPVWRSATLENLWPHGYSEIGTVTSKSANYVARYIFKKVNGDRGADHYTRTDPTTGEMVPIQPEYVTMSRRPGIGASWFERYASEVYPHDEVIVDGRPQKPPRFYDKLYAETDPEAFGKIAAERRTHYQPQNNTPDRLATRETCAKARISHQKRTLESS